MNITKNSDLHKHRTAADLPVIESHDYTATERETNNGLRNMYKTCTLITYIYYATLTYIDYKIINNSLSK